MKITKFKAPIYGSSIWIVIDKSFYHAFDKVEDLIDKRIQDQDKVMSTQALTYAYEMADGKYRMILFLRPNCKPGEVAHESKHLINILFNWHGVKLSLTNDEHECYMLDWLVDRCHNAITRYKNEK